MLRLFFLSAQQEKQLFLHVTCWSASMFLTGHHAAVSLQCSSRAPHCTRGSLSLGLFAGPWPAVPIERSFTGSFFLLCCLEVLENNGCGNGDVVVRCEWFRCVLLLCCLSSAVVCCFSQLLTRKLLPRAKRYCEIRRH
ncbi:hypothetical protein TcG_04436 [Trypanosoma cruzi]|nr:hypothetical protein TcG_04436 [Trypanosoma cruzi]